MEQEEPRVRWDLRELKVHKELRVLRVRRVKLALKELKVLREPRVHKELKAVEVRKVLKVLLEHKVPLVLKDK